ncbi:MAG: DUF4340 domain-containing protein [Opitutales bacterium]
MRFKFTIFLIGLNLVAFALIAYLTHKGTSADGSARSLAAQIGREIIEADRIELRGSGLEQPTVLTKEGSIWQISQPMRWQANYFAINRILNQLQFIEQEATFSVAEILSRGQSLADYGLEEPTIELIISEGQSAVHLSIGTLTDIGNNVYLLGPDRERIFVVGRTVIDSLIVGLSELRNREIFAIPVFEVNELSLQIKSTAESSNGDLKVRLANTAGQWRFEAPLSAQADPALVANTINALASLKVARFLDADASDPAMTGLDAPYMRVTLHGNKRRQTLLIGNRVEGSSSGNSSSRFFAKLEDNPSVFTVDSRPFENLMLAQESLRERNFMPFDKTKLNAIHISENGRQIRLQKIESGDWQVLKSAGNGEIQPRRADPEVMETLIQDLQQIRAKAFVIDAPNTVDLERLGFNSPRRVVELQFDAAESISLQLAHPEDENEKLYAKTKNRESVYEVERRPTLQFLPLNTLHYRNRLLESLPKAALIRGLQLTNLKTGKNLLNLRPQTEDEWINLLDQMEAVQAEAVSALLQGLRQFVVKSYLSDQYSDGYQLDPEKKLPWAYRLRADILLPGGETDQTREIDYVFTERLSGTMQIGGSAARNTIFELELDLVEALYVLVEEMPLPPESLDKPVTDPEAPTPVSEPQQAPTNTP